MAELGSGRRTGIEVDGTTARLVEVADGRVVSHRCETAATPEDAVRALVGRAGRFCDGGATISWTQDVEVRRLPLRQTPSAAWRAAMLEAAEEELFVADADIALAGAVEELPNGTLEAVVAVTAAGAVAPLWELASHLNMALTVPAFCLTADGTYVAMRDGSADVTVVDGGRCVACRSLDQGSVGSLLGALHIEREAARARFTRVVTGTAQIDAEAVVVVDAHVARVTGLVAEQVRAWRQQDVRTGAKAFVIGSGATIPSLPFRLHEAGLAASNPPLPSGVDVAAIPEWDRFAYYGALAAAMTPLDRSATATLANRHVETARLRASDLAARRRKQGVAVGVASVALAVLGFPLVVSSWRVESANAHQAAALERFSAVARIDAEIAHAEAGRAVYARHASADVRWAELHRHVAAALPPGAAVEAVRFSRQGADVVVDVSAAFAGDPFTAVSAWADRMRSLNRPSDAADPANAVAIRTFAYERETRTVRASLLVTIPVRPPFVEPRSLPGTGQSTDGRS